MVLKQALGQLHFYLERKAYSFKRPTADISIAFCYKLSTGVHSDRSNVSMHGEKGKPH